ncbi:MAG: hypothetical protein KME31_02885 [Tolypothrix carrinoi HA7290-LM1]|nr:hypothetical protein [Tolypothrix carrinoi HA7290-LM1]
MDSPQRAGSPSPLSPLSPPSPPPPLLPSSPPPLPRRHDKLWILTADKYR